ncbi:MAG: divalent-cation tolerance protein CutA [Gammaproteobacteria bacterium]|nr:divalent-cation tolerance protein CutA [Gammaproteobacteria bacterium]
MKQIDTAVVILTTAPNPDSAKQLAEQLLERQLVACVNIIDGITSMYRWKDAIEQETESQLIMKTTKEQLTEIESLLSEIHPYDVPELISLPIQSTGNDYGHWLLNSVKPLEDRSND